MMEKKDCFPRGAVQVNSKDQQAYALKRETTLSTRGQRNDIVSAIADTNMFPSKWSSPSFLHGADMLIPVIELAEDMLMPDESIEAILNVRWRKPITSNIELVIRRDKNVFDFPKVIDGLIKTNRDILAFAGRFIEKPINRDPVRNPYVANSICECSGCRTISKDGIYMFHLHQPDSIDVFKDAGLQAASLAEILTSALSTIRIPNYRPFILELMGGLSDVVLATNPEAIFNSGTLNVRIMDEEIRTGRSGFTIVPFRYEFPHQLSVGTGFGAGTDSDVLTKEQISRG